MSSATPNPDETRPDITSAALESLKRKRRRLQIALGVALLLLVLLGGSLVWLWQQQRAETLARQQAANQKVLEVLERARVLLEDGWQKADLGKLQEATAQADRTAEMADIAEVSAEVRDRVNALRNKAAERLNRAQKDRALLDALLEIAHPREGPAFRKEDNGQIKALAEPSADEQYREAFRRWGLDLDQAPEAEVMSRLRDEPGDTLREIIAHLDAWALERRRQHRPADSWRRLLRVADQLDRSPLRRQLRAVLADNLPPRELIVAELTRRLLPWTALGEMERGKHWRRVLELRGRVDPGTEPTMTVLLLVHLCSASGDAAGAEDVLQRALQLRPTEVAYYAALGRILEGQGSSRLAEAIRFYQAARALRPRLGVALGRALTSAGRAEEGEAVLCSLVRQEPNNPDLHLARGRTLFAQGKLGEAAEAFRAAIRLQPDNFRAIYELGLVLHKQGKLREAEAAYRTVLRLTPDFPEAFARLGLAMNEVGTPAEGVRAARQAIRLKPDFPEPYVTLGLALRDLGKFPEALVSLRRGAELGGGQPAWPVAKVATLIAQVKRLGELDSDLTAFRTGKRKPSGPDEAGELAAVCATAARRLYATSARFYAEAFVGKPALAADLPGMARYRAACAAVLAGCAKREDTPAGDAKERARLRQQGLDWLQADLAAWKQQLATGKDQASALRMLTRWEQDPNLACVRDPGRLKDLPQEERTAWQQLWAEAAALRKRAEAQ
jgi:predicted Zn-dependent protease